MGAWWTMAALLIAAEAATAPSRGHTTHAADVAEALGTQPGGMSALEATAKPELTAKAKCELPPPGRADAPLVPDDNGHVNYFEGKLKLVLLDDKANPSIKDGRTLWALTEPLTYRPGGGVERITIPCGFHTDLASIPRFGWVILPPDGPWAKAAVVHDFLYATKGTGVVWETHPKGITRPTPYDRKEADGILREAMLNRGVDGTSATIIYTAVRWFGGGGWGS